MSSTLPDGGRASDANRKSAIYHAQHFIVQNNSTFWDRGENTIYEATVPFSPTSFPANTEVSFSQGFPSEEYWRELFHTKIVRDGSIIGYDINDVTTGKTLLKVHDHGNTTSSVRRTFKAFFRSPVKKWDVENRELFHDLPNGFRLGAIHDVFPDHRVFFPDGQGNTPRLEMQAWASLGTKYALAVTDIPEPVGWVESSVVGRLAPRNETYAVVLRNCTREEAVLWLTMVIATDMKRRKVETVQSGRASLLAPALI